MSTSDLAFYADFAWRLLGDDLVDRRHGLLLARTGAKMIMPTTSGLPRISIIVQDLDSHEPAEETIITDDVVVIVAGRHYVASVHKYATGTQVWTIKVGDGDADDE